MLWYDETGSHHGVECDKVFAGVSLRTDMTIPENFEDKYEDKYFEDRYDHTWTPCQSFHHS